MLRSGYKDTRDYEHYKRLADCYLAVNNSSQAYEYLTQGNHIDDSVMFQVIFLNQNTHPDPSTSCYCSDCGNYKLEEQKYSK